MSSSPPPRNKDPNDIEGFRDALSRLERVRARVNDPKYIKIIPFQVRAQVSREIDRIRAAQRARITNYAFPDYIRHEVDDLRARVAAIESDVVHNLERQGKLLQQESVNLANDMFRDRFKDARPDLRPPRLSPIFEFLLAALPRQRRNDTLLDIGDWYPEWIAGHGRLSAHCLCAFKVVAALGGSLLDVLERVASIVGKLTGAK